MKVSVPSLLATHRPPTAFAPPTPVYVPDLRLVLNYTSVKVSDFIMLCCVDNQSADTETDGSITSCQSTQTASVVVAATNGVSGPQEASMTHTDSPRETYQLHAVAAFDVIIVPVTIYIEYPNISQRTENTELPSPSKSSLWPIQPQHAGQEINLSQCVKYFLLMKTKTS